MNYTDKLLTVIIKQNKKIIKLHEETNDLLASEEDSDEDDEYGIPDESASDEDSMSEEEAEDLREKAKK